MAKVRTFPIILIAGLAISAVSSLALGADVRGSLQGIDALQPTPPPEVPDRLRSYWEEPNGALDVRRPHAVPERDLAVIVTGPSITEASRPVDLPVAGGRCQPGTVVVAPNTVLRVQNRGWMTHEFFATAADSEAPIEQFQPEATAPASVRQVQIPQAGTYVLRDRLSPFFRCWIVVGPGQGRVLTPNAEGAFRIQGLSDGEYTVKIYFEGRVVGEAPVRVAGARDMNLPAINVSAAPPASGAAAQGGQGGGAEAPAAAEPRRGRRRGR